MDKSGIKAVLARGMNPMLRRLPLKQPASSLLYTVSICLLVAMMLSAMILLFGYDRLSADWTYHLELAQDNLESGKNLVLYDGNPQYGSYSGNLFESAVDSYYVQTQPWGVYGLLLAEGVHGRARKREASLYGAVPRDAFAASLYMRDQNRPLTLAGNTVLQGDIYAPEAGIKPGFVGRTGFTGAKLYDGKLRHSSDHALDLSYESLAETSTRLRNLNGSLAVRDPLPPRGGALYGQWESKPVELGGSGRIRLSGMQLSGHVVVTAPQVYIAADCKLNDVLVFGNIIHVEEGFEGRAQLFATDSLIIDRKCKLRYPSAAVLASKDDWGYLEIGEESLLEGLLLSDADLLAPNTATRSYVLVRPKATVAGTAIVAANFDLQGSVIGTVVAGNFRLVTSGAVYENVLLDATIKNEGLSPMYAMPMLQKQPADYQEILNLIQTP